MPRLLRHLFQVDNNALRLVEELIERFVKLISIDWFAMLRNGGSRARRFDRVDFEVSESCTFRGINHGNHVREFHVFGTVFDRVVVVSAGWETRCVLLHIHGVYLLALLARCGRELLLHLRGYTCQGLRVRVIRYMCHGLVHRWPLKLDVLFGECRTFGLARGRSLVVGA